MTSKLRLATLNDLAAAQKIVRAAYTPYTARIGREPGPMLDDYASLINEGRVHVAERDDLVQGVLVLIPKDNAMLLDDVAVTPQAQGTGLGRIMLKFAERATIETGYSKVMLYTRMGYAETHRVEEKGLRRVYMRKLLSRAMP